MATLTVQGVRGELRHGYRVAAALGTWTFSSETHKVTAEIAEKDDVWFDEPGPKTIRLRVGTEWWEWAVQPDLHGNGLVAVVAGAPRVRS